MRHLNLLRCPKCRVELTVVSVVLACPTCKAQYPRLYGIPRFTPTVDDGFDHRWATNPKPQTTTAGVFEHKTGLSLAAVQGLTVLDAGCGIGRFSQVVAAAGGQVIGVDGSAHGVEAAAKLVPEGTFLQADLLKLPLANESMDLAFSIGVLHHTADPVRAFNEVARTVRPGGQFAVWVYITPGGDAEFHVVDPQTVLAAEFFHAITRACPPDKLYAACAKYAPRLREMYRSSGWGPFQKVVQVSMSNDDAECVSDTFDWHCPQYRSGHTNSEVRGWFESAGFDVVWTGDFPVSMRGVKRR